MPGSRANFKSGTEVRNGQSGTAGTTVPAPRLRVGGGNARKPRSRKNTAATERGPPENKTETHERMALEGRALSRPCGSLPKQPGWVAKRRQAKIYVPLVDAGETHYVPPRIAFVRVRRSGRGVPGRLP